MNKTILVPIDYSDVTDALLAEARQLAESLGANLHLVHAAMVDPEVYSHYMSGMGTASPRKSKAEILQAAAKHLTATAETFGTDVRGVTTSVLDGSAGPAIMKEASRIKPMMIVLGSHGHGALHHLLAGSVCEYVMKHSACPLTIVPSRVGTYGVEAETAQTATTA
jgi:nucleotide-binding universal stress UspA family protein